MAAGHVLAHRRGRDLVVADRAHHPAPGRFQRQLRAEQDHRQHQPEEPGIKQLHQHGGPGHRVDPPVRHPLYEGRIGLQIDLIGHRPGPRDPGHVQHAPVQPFLVAQHRDDDLADAQRGNREVIRAQPERGLGHAPGRQRRQRRTQRPRQQHRQPEPAQIALRGRVDRLDRGHGRVEHGAVKEEARDQHRDHCRGLGLSAQAPVQPDGRRQRHREDRKRDQHAPSARGKGALGRLHGDQHRREPAKRDEAHHARVEQPRIAPLHVEPERDHRRDQPHVQDHQRAVPARGEPLQNDQRRHRRKQQRRAHPAARSGIGLTGAHTDFPLNSPVGRNSSTTIRIAKLTANLYSVDSSCKSPSLSKPT